MADSQLFRNADGTFTRRVFDRSVHVPGANGAWVPLDLTLARVDGGRIAPRVARWPVSFAGGTATADGDLVRLVLDADHDIAFSPLGVAKVAGRVDGARARYPGTWPRAELELSADAAGVKENLVLAGPPDRSVFEFGLRLRGLTPVLDAGSGDIRLLDGVAVRATIPAGWMRDAHGTVSRNVHYALSAVDGGWRLRMSLDAVWLRTAAYPVVVDPSVQINGDVDDTTVTSGDNANHSGEIDLRVGRDGSGRVSAAYLRFNLGGLANQYVSGATLNLFNAGGAGSCAATATDVYAVGAPWSGGSLRWPGAPLAQHLSRQSFAACAAGRVSFPFPPEVAAGLVTDWTHGAPFHGLSVRSANEGDPAGFKRFASANAGNANAPYLDVTYAPQGAAYGVEEVTLPTNNLAGQLKAMVRNRGAVTWPAGGTTRFGFIVKQGTATVETSPQFALPATVGPGGAVQVTVPIAPKVPGDYQVYMTMYDGGRDFQPTYGVPYGSFPLRVVNVPPGVSYEQPGSGAAVGSITPTLYAEGTDPDAWPGTGLKYNFKLCSGTPDAPTGCVQSGWITSATWSPPAGTLAWSRTYWWWVQAHDNATAGPFVGPLALVTQVPQPEITSHLGGANENTEAPGLDPQVGNYAASTTDAAVPTVGPDLTITRTYNSLDPRTDNAFGTGWSSRLDTELVEDGDGSGSVVVTLPTGRQVRFGRNPDRSFAPPAGQNLTLVYDSGPGQYTLRDAGGGIFLFNPWGRLLRVTDPNGLIEDLLYDSAGPTGKPTAIINQVSRRRLTLSWTGGHVTAVTTDPPATGGSGLRWTYEYDGPRLVAACQPGVAPNCTHYTYRLASHYRSVVLDDNPRGYWRLGETSGGGGAANVAARKPGADQGGYTGVALGGAGAIAGTSDGAAAFDGQASRVDLPRTLPSDDPSAKLISSTMTAAVELWFRTTAGGVLASYADKPAGSVPTQSTPILYVGQDGLLRGGFWSSAPVGARQVVSQAAVNDDRWHHVVLSGFINSQTLYLDGVAIGTLNGVIDHDQMPHLTIGSGRTVGWPSGNDGDFVFNGRIDEVAVYRHALGPAAVARHTAAAQPVDVLVRGTLPQDDRVFTEMVYDDVNDRVASLTDHDGEQWRLDVPGRNDAIRTVTLHGPYPDVTYTFDADHSGRIAARTQDGKTRGYAYNTEGFLARLTDENGHTASYTTDERGNPLSTTTCRKADSCQTSYATYFHNPDNALDPRNDRKVTSSDARSANADDPTYRTTYGYDTRGRLVSTSYPAPNGAAAPTERWTYSTGTESADGGGTVPAGLLLSHTGKRATAVTRYIYRSTGDLAEQQDPSGLRSRYEYDGVGRRIAKTALSAVGQSFGTARYTYTPRSLLETVTEPAVTNPISGATHTLRTSYTYDGNGNQTRLTQSDTAGGDPPRTTTYTYDEHDHLVATTFPDSTRETRSIRSAGQEIRTTDARGITWITGYDHRSRPVRQAVSGPGADPEDPDATLLVTETRTYDAAGRLASVRDAMGRQTNYTYYDDDRLATITALGVSQADGSRHDVVLERHEYDPAGNQTRLTEAGGRVTATSYDPAGLPAAVTLDPGGLGRVTAYTRESDGQPRTVSVSGAAQTGRVETTSYGYDNAGRLVREDASPTTGDTLSVTYDYDERGLLTAQTDRRRMTTSYEYDPLGRLVRTVQPAVTVWAGGKATADIAPTTVVGRNTFGEESHNRDPNGAVSTTSYDLMGRPVAAQAPDYTSPGGQVLRPVTRTAYDEVGNPVRTTDPLGRETTRVFDPHGNLLSEVAPQVGSQPSTTTYTYDRNGEQLSVTDPAGSTVLATYDELGRQLTSTEAERRPRAAFYTTTFGYDDAGNRTSLTTPGNHTTAYTYNPAGEQLSVTDPTVRTTRYTYDIAGRQASVTGPDGITTQTGYDLLGRPVTNTVSGGGQQAVVRRAFDANDNLTQETSPEGRVRSWAYDALNRTVRQDEVVDGGHTIRVSFGYDAAGNRTRYVNGNGHATDYTINSLGLPEATVEPATAAHPAAADRTWTIVYDAAGQAVRRTAPGGVVQTTEYDEQGRPVAVRGSGAEGTTADRTFSHDPAGRLASFGGPAGNTTLSYDDRGNLLGASGAAGTSSYSYTADSQVASRTDASGTASYSYDSGGRLRSVVDGLSGRTVDFTYDAGGRLSYSNERGITQARRVQTYDRLGRLATDKLTEFDPGGGAPRVILGTEYGYDRDDNLTAKRTISNDSTSANSYGYDGAGRLVSWTAPNGTTTGYGWDDAGNRTTAGNTTYTYNERNQLTADGTRTYGYQPRGTLAWVTGGGTSKTVQYDAFGRMTADGATAYGYDSLGRVAARGTQTFGYADLANDVVTGPGSTTSRLPDGSPLSDKATGSATARLLYADQHGDITGRYRGLDSYGQRSYDPFGAVTATTGEVTDLGYQGEWTDPTTGAVNMHARWYAPAAGSFTSRDTWDLDANQYAYGAAQPLTMADPSGHYPVCKVAKRLPVVGSVCLVKEVATARTWRQTKGALLDMFGLEDTTEYRFRPKNNCCSTRSDKHSRGLPRPPKGDTGARTLTRGSGPRPLARTKTAPGGRSTGRPRTPPPPPLWVINIMTAVPRPEAGKTVTSQPNAVSAVAGTVNVIDRSDQLAAAASTVTDDASDRFMDSILQAMRAVDWLSQRLPPTDVDQISKDSGSCLDEGNEWYSYWDLDSNGRATGADACLNSASLPGTGAGDIPPFKATAPVKGHVPGMTDKGHLIGALYGGRGDRPENLVPLTPTANKYMYNQFEKCVARQLSTGEVIHVIAVPYYQGSSLQPAGVVLNAFGNRGYTRSLTVLNQPYLYPRGAKTYCK